MKDMKNNLGSRVLNGALEKEPRRWGPDRHQHAQTESLEMEDMKIIWIFSDITYFFPSSQ